MVPIHVDWHEGHLYAMVGRNDVKVRNVNSNRSVCLHYQVSEQTGWDSLMVWGSACVLDDLDDKRRLWTGVMSYDLDEFSPGGPDDSPDTVFLQIEVARALVLRNFGFDGRDEWLPGS